MREADQEKNANTFEKIARHWHTNLLGRWQLSTARDIFNWLEEDIVPEIGALPISTIRHKQLIDTLRKIEARGANEIAKRLKANCARIFSYAIQHGYTDRNRAADLTDILKPVRKGHFAAISVDELPNFLRIMDRNEARLYMPTQIILRLILVLFFRSSELICTTRRHLARNRTYRHCRWRNVNRTCPNGC